MRKRAEAAVFRRRLSSSAARRTGSELPAVRGEEVLGGGDVELCGGDSECVKAPVKESRGWESGCMLSAGGGLGSPLLKGM